MAKDPKNSHYIRLDIPKVELSPKEKAFLESLRRNMARALAEDEIELQRLVKDFVGWEIKHHNAQTPYPTIGLDKVSGFKTIAAFDEKRSPPTIYLFLRHPVIRDDSLQVVLSLFHEFQHYLSWRRNPMEFQKEKGLPADHPIEKAHEMAAVNDLTAMVREGSREISPSV